MAKAKIKTLLGTGLAALCSHIKQCNTALGDLSEATANGFEETDDILHEKQDVTAAVGFIATESLEGKLRLRAAKAPTEKISAQYHITSTVKYTDAQEGGT